MRIAFYTYSYIDRLAMEPAAVLPAIAAAGYDGIDLSATWRNDADPALFPPHRRREIARLCASLGLRIEALVTHLPLVESLREGLPLNLPAALELAAELGAGGVTVHAGSRGATPAEAAENWRAAIQHLRECADVAARAGVWLAVDALYPTYLTPDARSVAALLSEANHPSLGHNFDPCYVAVTGGGVEDAAALLSPWIVHAHLKDYRGRYPEFEHCIPGAGELDHGAWARALLPTWCGREGALAVECFPEMPLEHALPTAYRTVHAALEAAAREPTPAPADSDTPREPEPHPTPGSLPV
jgi:sugar phosphate isomerase/epimerase